ncbi:MAG TPA: MFS transporter [Thermomicrobiales bacterium]|nr:MFS transporter [Thermomicrobiales bacterium]
MPPDPPDTASPAAGSPRQHPGRRSRFSGLRKGFVALTYRNYRLFWLGQLVSVTGTWMQSLALSWLVYEILGATPFQLGLVNVLQFLPVLLLGIPAGVIADRFPKRRILLTTQSAMMVLSAILAVLVITDRVLLWQVYVLATGLGMARALDMPTRQAFVSEMVEKDDLMNAIALNAALFNTGRIVGPALAGALLAVVGPGPLFAINAASFIAVLAGLLLMRTRPITGTSEESPLQRLRDGLAYVRRDPLISRTVLMVGTIGIFGMNFNIWIPVLASDEFAAGSSAYGTLFAAMGAGSLIGALSLAFFGQGPSRRRMIAAALLMGSAELVLALAAANGTAVMLGAAALALVGFASTNTMSTANTLVQTAASDELRGRVMAVYMTVFAGSIPIGALIAGWVTGQFGVATSLVMGGTLILAAAAFQILSTRHMRAAEPASHAPEAKPAD